MGVRDAAMTRHLAVAAMPSDLDRRSFDASKVRVLPAQCQWTQSGTIANEIFVLDFRDQWHHALSSMKVGFDNVRNHSAHSSSWAIAASKTYSGCWHALRFSSRTRWILTVSTTEHGRGTGGMTMIVKGCCDDRARGSCGDAIRHQRHSGNLSSAMAVTSPACQ